MEITSIMKSWCVWLVKFVRFSSLFLNGWGFFEFTHPKKWRSSLCSSWGCKWRRKETIFNLINNADVLAQGTLLLFVKGDLSRVTCFCWHFSNRAYSWIQPVHFFFSTRKRCSSDLVLHIHNALHARHCAMKVFGSLGPAYLDWRWSK